MGIGCEEEMKKAGPSQVPLSDSIGISPLKVKRLFSG